MNPGTIQRLKVAKTHLQAVSVSWPDNHRLFAVQALAAAMAYVPEHQDRLLLSRMITDITQWRDLTLQAGRAAMLDTLDRLILEAGQTAQS